MPDLVITTLAERSEYLHRLYEMLEAWPEFMKQDAAGHALFWQVAPAFPELAIVATDDGEPIARGQAIPFVLHEEDRAGQLPASGWDRVLSWGMVDRIRGRTPDTVSALEVAIAPTHRGLGLSARMLTALRDAAAAQGFSELVAPVRPNGKPDPYQPIEEHARATRADGLPVDPWLRVHVRAGGTIEQVAPTSMLIGGSLGQWRDWTGLPFDADGSTVVPHALVPVHVDLAQDHAVYVEPNVWVRHRL